MASVADFGLQGFPVRPADVIREIEHLVDVGVSHFQVAMEDMATMRRFIDEVVPAARMDRQPLG